LLFSVHGKRLLAALGGIESIKVLGDLLDFCFCCDQLTERHGGTSRVAEE
jgi:hypothetical protein